MRFFLRGIFYMLLVAFAVSTVKAQQSFGTLEIQIAPEGATSFFENYNIIVSEAVTRSTIGEYKASTTGAVTIRNIAFGVYRIDLFGKEGGLISQQRVTINSNIPVKIELATKLSSEVIVTATAPEMSKPVISTPYTSGSIAQLPAASGPKKMEAVLLNTPGIVPDEDGRMHMRGEDAQLQYVVDGIPITTNQTRIYSSLFNAGIIKSAEIIRGGFNAEYGVALSGVVNINTRSGFEKPFFADAAASMGSWNTKDRSFSVGGNLDGKAALFFAYSSSETDRYLDPIRDFEPNHTDGYTHNYFAKADFLLSDNLSLQLLGTTNLANFGIPNGMIKTPAQDQREDVSDYTFGGRLNVGLTDNSSVSLLGYKRRMEATNTSGGLMQILTPADSAKAVAENEDFFIGSHRIDEAVGGQLEYSLLTKWFDVPNTFKAGVDLESYPLSEFFSFAVMNPALSNPDSSGGDDRFIPYDLTKGGKPFLVNQSKTGSRFSAYIQDQIAFTDWIINAGVRFDMFKLIEEESAISPRLNVAYHVNEDLWLRGSYNRVVMEAPVENILVSSSDEAKALVGTEQGTTPTQVMPESEHVLEIGGTYELSHNTELDLSIYGKFIENFIVKVELGTSGIIFPVNLKEGMVAGGELEFRLHDWNHLSATVGIGSCISLGMKPEDSSSPIAAGLILGEEGENYSHPFGGEDVFPTEHNQLLTASFTLNYNHPNGLFGTLGGRFDMGLPFDLADKNGNGLDEAAARAELKRRGYSDNVIDLLALEGEVENGKISPDKTVAPHFVLDLSAGYDFKPELGIPVKLTASVLNLFDTKYLYKFESSFGGTHFGLPRTIMVGLEAHL